MKQLVLQTVNDLYRVGLCATDLANDTLDNLSNIVYIFCFFLQSGDFEDDFADTSAIELWNLDV